MEFVTNAISFVTDNWGVIVGVAGGLYAAALAVVNFTKTPKDNEILSKVYGVAMFAAGLFTKEARGLREDGTPKA